MSGTGVRVNGGRLHVWRPGIKPITRCGIRARRVDVVDGEVPIEDTPAEERCRKCFPGTGVKP